jgi:hypothetical protein
LGGITIVCVVRVFGFGGFVGVGCSSGRVIFMGSMVFLDCLTGRGKVSNLKKLNSFKRIKLFNFMMPRQFAGQLCARDGHYCWYIREIYLSAIDLLLLLMMLNILLTPATYVT